MNIIKSENYSYEVLANKTIKYSLTIPDKGPFRLKPLKAKTKGTYEKYIITIHPTSSPSTYQVRSTRESSFSDGRKEYLPYVDSEQYSSFTSRGELKVAKGSVCFNQLEFSGIDNLLEYLLDLNMTRKRYWTLVAAPFLARYFYTVIGFLTGVHGTRDTQLEKFSKELNEQYKKVEESGGLADNDAPPEEKSYDWLNPLFIFLPFFFYLYTNMFVENYQGYFVKVYKDDIFYMLLVLVASSLPKLVRRLQDKLIKIQSQRVLDLCQKVMDWKNEGV